MLHVRRTRTAARTAYRGTTGEEEFDNATAANVTAAGAGGNSTGANASSAEAGEEVPPVSKFTGSARSLE